MRALLLRVLISARCSRSRGVQDYTFGGKAHTVEAARDAQDRFSVTMQEGRTGQMLLCPCLYDLVQRHLHKVGSRIQGYKRACYSQPV